jgi:hypothetical protein
MSIFITVLQIAVAAFIIWGLFNESKLVDFEDWLIAKIKARVKHKNHNTYHRSSNDRNCA